VLGEGGATPWSSTRGEASSQVFYDLDRREAVGRHTTASEVIHITVTLPEGRGKIERTIDRTSQSQALRIETGSRTGG